MIFSNDFKVAEQLDACARQQSEGIFAKFLDKELENQSSYATPFRLYLFLLTSPSSFVKNLLYTNLSVQVEWHLVRALAGSRRFRCAITRAFHCELSTVCGLLNYIGLIVICYFILCLACL